MQHPRVDLHLFQVPSISLAFWTSKIISQLSCQVDILPKGCKNGERVEWFLFALGTFYFVEMMGRA